MGSISSKDMTVLRELGLRLNDAGHRPENDEKRRLWKRHNSLVGERPMVLVYSGGVADDLVPLDQLECENDWARDMERNLRLKLYHARFIPDDFVIEPRVTYSHPVTGDFFGFTLVEYVGETGQGRGSTRWDPPIVDLTKGIEQIRYRRWNLNKAASMEQKERLESVFHGILPVEYRGWYWWSTGMTESLIKLIGMQGMMVAMMDQPDLLHQLMSLLRDDKVHMLEWHEKQGLLLPNNQDDQIGSGGLGYTDELPGKGFIEGAPGRICDMWGLSESQETVMISPVMFNEFIFPYQLPIISKFGLACYGCCEPLHSRWDSVKQIPNLRSVSVSPWADESKMAEYIDGKYIYSRRPNPVLVSTGNWDEDAIARDIMNTQSLTKGRNVEYILKDVHTVNRDPQRLTKWASITKKLTAK